MRKLTLLLISLFGFRILFYFLWIGKHDFEYFTKLNNIREAATWIGLGAMASFLFGFCKEKYCGLILYIFVIFSFSFAVMALAPFMPNIVSKVMGIFRPRFWELWSGIFVCTLGYYIFTFKLKAA